MPRRILLADDSVTAQNMGKKILSDAGYEVITVSNGSAALKKAIELLPDIAVLDVYMPGYSGLEVCKQLKENGKTAEIPILLTVGKLEPFKSDEALKARANAFIVKPFEATELLAVIRKIEDATLRAAKTTKPKVVLAKAMATPGDAPENQETGIEEKGWKSRLAVPGARKAEPVRSAEETEEDSAAVTGTEFRDLTPPASEESALRRESAFTADPAEAQISPEAAAPIDISPEEIAAIKAAVEILSGEGDHAPVLNVTSPENAVRPLAPEPEEQVADSPALANVEVRIDVSTQPKPVGVPARPHWIAEAVELTQADANSFLEQEMQNALGAPKPAETFNTYSLASFIETAGPVDDEPIASELTARAEVDAAPKPAPEPAPALAVAASASGDSPVAGSSAAIPVPHSSSPTGVALGLEDLRPVESASAAAPALEGVGAFSIPGPNIASAPRPSTAPRDPSAPEDEIDSRTKWQMDAAWSNWREIRSAIVTPNLTEQLAEVAAASVKDEAAAQGPDSQVAAHDSASIASIVDSVLAEMRPKLVEEIARKLAAKRE